MSDRIDRAIAAYRAHAAVEQKGSIALASEVFGPSDWESGMGDDGAVINVGSEQVVAGGEAMFPPFVEADPRGAGFAAVLANINDLAAMGAEPLAILDTVVAPEETARLVLEGISDAAEMYRVPVVGGHLTVRPGPPSVAAFGLGRVERPLSVRNVAPGQTLMLACSIDGTMRDDFPFFASFNERRDQMADDVRLLFRVATDGHVAAAKDVSMAGLIGSLAMLLEARGAGATVDLDRLPVPDGVDLGRWLVSFPAYAFLLCVEPENVNACQQAFVDRGLICADIGVIDDSGQLRLVDGEESAVAVDLGTESLTGITPL